MSVCLGDKCDYCLRQRIKKQKDNEFLDKQRRARIDKYLPKKKK